MFIISLEYVKPLVEVEKHLEDHRAFLAKQYEENVFLASGPKVPRTGGVIIANSTLNFTEIEAIISLDPFKKHGVASYTITQFTPVKYHSALAGIL